MLSEVQRSMEKGVRRKWEGCGNRMRRSVDRSLGRDFQLSRKVCEKINGIFSGNFSAGIQ